jgi:hypothetical protein
MNAANDTNAQASNATHSIALTAIGTTFVVSCFKIGVDGKVDTDIEIIFREFTDAQAARRFYADKVGLLACTAAKMDAEIDWVYHCVSSLVSCLHREVRNEARILLAAVAELEIATLARRNPAREDRKTKALARAAEVLASRTAGLDGNIQKEAESRALRGQP